jgi:hypothetical protein
MTKAKLRNHRFYDAPLAGIVRMNRELRHVDSLGVRMFLQTFLLALTQKHFSGHSAHQAGRKTSSDVRALRLRGPWLARKMTCI